MVFQTFPNSHSAIKAGEGDVCFGSGARSPIAGTEDRRSLSIMLTSRRQPAKVQAPLGVGVFRHVET